MGSAVDSFQRPTEHLWNLGKIWNKNQNPWCQNPWCIQILQISKSLIKCNCITFPKSLQHNHYCNSRCQHVWKHQASRMTDQHSKSEVLLKATLVQQWTPCWPLKVKDTETTHSNEQIQAKRKKIKTCSFDSKLSATKWKHLIKGKQHNAMQSNLNTSISTVTLAKLLQAEVVIAGMVPSKALFDEFETAHVQTPCLHCCQDMLHVTDSGNIFGDRVFLLKV